jgi:hypothetical protein
MFANARVLLHFPRICSFFPTDCYPMPSYIKSLLTAAALSRLTSATAIPEVSYLHRRQDDTPERSITSISCGAFSSADNLDSYDNIDWLRDRDEMIYAAGGACVRTLLIHGPFRLSHTSADLLKRPEVQEYVWHLHLQP